MCLSVGQAVLDEKCWTASKGSVGLLWDVTSFILLLMMLRLFGSHYFSHIVLDIVVQRSLATRWGCSLTPRHVTDVNGIAKLNTSEFITAAGHLSHCG